MNEEAFRATSNEYVHINSIVLERILEPTNDETTRCVACWWIERGIAVFFHVIINSTHKNHKQKLISNEALEQSIRISIWSSAMKSVYFKQRTKTEQVLVTSILHTFYSCSVSSSLKHTKVSIMLFYSIYFA